LRVSGSLSILNISSSAFIASGTPCIVVDQLLGDRHKQCGGDALSGDISYGQCQMILVDKEEILEISADLLGRGHSRVYIEIVPSREGGEGARKLAGLYLFGHIEFRSYSFALSGELFDLLNKICNMS